LRVESSVVLKRNTAKVDLDAGVFGRHARLAQTRDQWITVLRLAHAERTESKWGIREQSLRFIELVVTVVLNQGARRERLQSFSPALAVGIQSAQPAFVVFYEGNTTDTMKYLRLKNIKTQKSERKKVSAKDEDEKGK